MIIYLVTNIINGLKYIGQTTKGLEYRREQHIYNALNGSKYYFHRAIKKHGVENFKWEIIERLDNIELLNEREIYYIKEHDTFNGDGYNLTEGGRGVRGWTHTDKTKEKLSKIAIKNGLGKIKTNKHKKNIGKSQVGISYIEKYGEEKAKELINYKIKSYVEKYGKVRAKQIITKQKLNNKSSNQEVRNKMSDTHKKLLKNGKRINISDDGRKIMSNSKIGNKNINYVSVDNELVSEIIKQYIDNNKRITKIMCERIGLSVHVIRRTLKENNIYEGKK